MLNSEANFAIRFVCCFFSCHFEKTFPDLLHSGNTNKQRWPVETEASHGGTACSTHVLTLNVPQRHVDSLRLGGFTASAHAADQIKI